MRPGRSHHPNIVRTHDIDQDGNLHFIVMEYVDGSNLLDVVKKFGKLDAGRAVSYMRQVALGLEYAYRNGIIHRDIKPGNILIDRRGKAQILDMGLARFFNDQNDNLTVKYDDKIVLGTADYVAPEQVANSHSVDTRADVYALGATMYFLLAGHPPFPTGTVSQKLLWHRTKDPTPLRQIRPDLHEALAAVVTRMMAKDPKVRFQTPGEVAQELERWLPERIALPAAAEMPVLSPAATVPVEDEPASEETEPMALQATPSSGLLVGAGTRSDEAYSGYGPSASSVVDLRTAPASRPTPGAFGSGGGNPFSGAAGGPGNPFGSHHAKDPWANAPPPEPGFGQGPRPFSAGNPFAGVDEATPLAGRVPSAARATTVFMPPPAAEDQANARKQILMYAALAATVVVAFGVVAWKFFLR